MKKLIFIFSIFLLTINGFSQVQIIQDSTIMQGDTIIGYNIRIVTTTVDTSGAIFVTKAQALKNIADLEEIIADEINSINNGVSFHNTGLKRENPRKIAQQKIATKSEELRNNLAILAKQKEILKLFRR